MAARTRRAALIATVAVLPAISAAEDGLTAGLDTGLLQLSSATGAAASPAESGGDFRPEGGPDLEGLAGLLDRRVEPMRNGNTHPGMSVQERARGIWDAFHGAVKEALNDPKYNLNGDEKYLLKSGTPGDATSVKDDGTIFLSVAAYRDWNCDTTVSGAFRKADQPEKLQVAVVEMNCREGSCWTGTGWAETRRQVSAPPDEDCYSALLQKPEMQPHLAAGRVKVLRLREEQSFGPLFSRYLAMKMYTGQSYIVQVDAHTTWRPSWDTSIVRQLKLTPSFPRSVISTYPSSSVSGDPATADTPHASPNALCRFHFSDGVVRLDNDPRFLSMNSSWDVPRHSMYVAAGFFAAHGSLLTDSPFDPLLPFIFMGEEIIMSARFWTSGWDIFGPTADIVGHEYYRKESPKFWESVDREFAGGTHNGLTALILQRVRNILQWPNDPKPDPPSVMDFSERFGLGTYRPLSQFWENAGVDLAKQRHGDASWCSRGQRPRHTLI